jgi:thiol:disulfide interchange protein
MKNLFTIILLIVLFTTVSFAQSGIKFFQGTWKEALAQAAKEDKPVFVDAFTVWCGPCKYMAANVFTVDSVGEYYNKNFINYKFDMEKGEGPSFASEYRITAYPTLRYSKSKGKVIHRVMGAKQPDQFIQDGKRAMSVYNYK